MKSAGLVLALALLPSPAAAAALRARGTLVDGAGRPLTATVLLDFRIVDVVTRAEIWSEAQEVEAAGGVYSATLGNQESLPAASAVKPGWRFLVRTPIGSGLSAGPLSAAGEDDRGVKLSRLLSRMGIEPAGSVTLMPAEYASLFERLPSPEAIFMVPDCAEGAPLARTCPKPTQKVLDREERLLRERLSRIPIERRAPPPAQFPVVARDQPKNPG